MSPRKPPSADSVHVLLKQALHGDDRFLLLDCLFRQNEKVITNSVSLLKPSDVFKLLESHIPMIHDLNYSWVRGHKKKNEAADEEARLALQ
ncbi:hypothetical protein Tco_0649741 [Tanacetum coccineum]